MHVERMEGGDIGAVLSIQERTAFLHWSEADFASELAHAYTYAFVLKKGILVVGFAIWHLMADEAELCAIAVDTGEQGRGLATFMMQSMHETLQAAGASNFFLEVRASNAPAQALYAKQGYTRVGIRRGYYSDGEDAWLFTVGGMKS